VVSNAHEHGRAPVTLRLWAADAAVVCTVTDRGPGIDDPLVGYARPRDPSEGLGLWAARQLCDVLDYERGAEGFAVRIAAFA
jgi:anti-sigma regulatory factor (Ser/Thr protein kinase)